MSAWFLLFVAGLLEVAWSVGLRASNGFTQPLPSVITVIALGASLWLLALSLRELPLGTAYAVWVGIGALGTALVGIFALGEPAQPARLGFLLLLGVAIVGLKLTAPNS